MTTELRPRSLGEILDATAQLYRSHFVLFAGIAVFPAAIPLALGLGGVVLSRYFDHGAAHQASAVAVVIAAAVVGGLSYLVMLGVSIAATSCAVSQVYFNETATIATAYTRVRPHWLRYVWLMVVAAVYAWTPTFLLFATVIGVAIPAVASHAGSPLAKVMVFLPSLVLLVTVPLGIWMMLRYSFALPVSIFEDRLIHASLKRSVFLTTDSRGRIFVMLLLIAVISSVISFAVQVPFLILGAVAASSASAPNSLPIVALLALITSQLCSFLVNSLLTPIYGIAVTLFYYDERIRKEGFDVEWMMQRANLIPHPVPTLAGNDLQPVVP